MDKLFLGISLDEAVDQQERRLYIAGATNDENLELGSHINLLKSPSEFEIGSVYALDGMARIQQNIRQGGFEAASHRIRQLLEDHSPRVSVESRAAFRGLGAGREYGIVTFHSGPSDYMAFAENEMRFLAGDPQTFFDSIRPQPVMGYPD